MEPGNKYENLPEIRRVIAKNSVQ